MAIQFDSASTAGGSGVNTLKWTHAPVAFSSAYIQFGINTRDADPPTSVNIQEGVAVDAVGGVDRGVFVQFNAYEYYNPPSSTFTASATWAATSLNAKVVAIVAYNNIKSALARGDAHALSTSAGAPAAPNFTAFTVSSTLASVCLCWVGTPGKNTTANDALYTLRVNVSDGGGSPAHLKAWELTADDNTTIFSFSTDTQAAGDNAIAFGTALTGTAAASTFRFTLMTLGVGR